MYVYKANANAQLTAKPRAAPRVETVMLLEAPEREASASEVELPLPLPFPPAEEVEFELVEEEPEPTVELPGMVEFEFEAGETDPAEEDCLHGQYVYTMPEFLTSLGTARPVKLTEDVPLLLEIGAPSRGT